eukprot:TRINITY_DN1619_c1_g1_i2.p3 TRINITY_DN1619_c1_g1~~TRINITY_DN1619_c1_g1_i2.p3  ORF type:complete len:479 (+),score=213.08 TRINITY_DN1619_c1_g1_i2:1274-2710(+)
MYRVLIAEADDQLGQSLERLVMDQGCRVVQAVDASQALGEIQNNPPDLVLLSATLPPAGGLEFLSRLKQSEPHLPVIVTAASGATSETIEATKLGAFDYVALPFEPGDMAALLRSGLEAGRFMRSPVKLDSDQAQALTAGDALLGRSRPMLELYKAIGRAAATDSTVLIQGESGTGKELVARAIHHQSPRRESPLVTVNCGAIPSELLESELFGHEKGAFTGAVRTRVGRFELAQGGTIFLDEIGDMPPLLQVKILRVLQEHAFERVGGTRTIEVDLRVLAATNQDLASRVEAGEFREDLYYRLNVVPIEVPPLRERKSDIPLLCDFFLERLARLKGLELKELSPEVRERFLRYSWPGNVRELENLLERLVVLAEGEMIGPEALPAKLDGEELLPDLEGDGELPAVVLPPGGLNLKSSLDQLERRLIAQALEQSGGVKAQAAALLGLNRTTLVQKLKKMGNLRYRSNHKDSDKQQEHP